MDNPFVLLETDLGEMLIELFPDKAPKTVENFLRYVDDGHYDGTIFHRVVRGFVIQGGGYDSDLQKRPPREPVPNEADNGLSNVHGSVAMARSEQRDSARDEFFINATDNPDLDHQDGSDEGFGYAVFGQVVEGVDLVRKINWRVVKARGDFSELPVDPVVIRAVRRFE